MKIKNIIKRKNKLISLNILKSKSHKKFQISDLKTNTKQTELYLKKAAQILYMYHLVGKRILFLGFPISFKHILKKTKHILIPESSWLNGMITNQLLRFNYLLTNQQKQFPFKIVQLLLKLQKKIDLIVVFNSNNNFNAIEEGYVSRIPIIGGSASLNSRDSKVTYKITGDFNYIKDKLPSSNFFISMVKMVLKKSIRMSCMKWRLKHQDFIKNKFKKKYRKKRFKKKYYSKNRNYR